MFSRFFSVCTLCTLAYIAPQCLAGDMKLAEEQLRSILATHLGTTPIKAEIGCSIAENRQRNNGETTEARGSVVMTAEHSSSHFTMTYDAKSIKELTGPFAAEKSDAGVVAALDVCGRLNALRMLSAANYISGWLKKAVVIIEDEEMLNGIPVRVLHFGFEKNNSFYPLMVKEKKKTDAKLWVDKDGFPLAFEVEKNDKFSAILIINREYMVTRRVEFMRHGDRVVMSRYEDIDGSDNRQTHSISTLNIVN